ncbi:MAG: sulfatase, partial [Colwellia sp.]|nr:sulfatase [Colwellia sp.]
MINKTIYFFSKLLLIITLLLNQPALAQDNDSSDKPNVLFILIDDFGWKDVGYNGSSFYETPEIDHLASEWMRFNNAYTPSPMCSPTRVSILTGKNPARHGVTQWLPGSSKAFTRGRKEHASVLTPLSKSSGIKGNEITLGESLKEIGYDTAFYGKWHMGSFDETGGPKNHGYDSQMAVIEANSASMFYPFRGNPDYFPNAKEGDNFTDLLTEHAIEFMTKDRKQPFYMHLAHFAMHSPILSKPALREKFSKKAQSLPELKNDAILDSYGHKAQKVRQDDADYAGELATLDHNIGRLVKALKASGQYDNTIIILTGDNGGMASLSFQKHPTSNFPLRTGKTFVFDGGLRTPLLIHWPGHSKAGMSSDIPVTSTDFYPTLLEMIGAPLISSQHLEGLSLVPLFKEQKAKELIFNQRPLFFHFPHYQAEGGYPASAIRVGDYKLIRNYHHQTLLLFNL